MTTGKARGPKAETMLMLLGGFYVVCAGFGLLMSLFQAWLQQYLPKEQVIDQARFVIPMQQIWRLHLPWVVGLGGAYLLLGWRLPRLPRAKFIFSWILMGLTSGVAISYVVHTIPYSRALSQSMPSDALRTISWFSSISGAGMCLGMAVVPQLWIHWRMKHPA